MVEVTGKRLISLNFTPQTFLLSWTIYEVCYDINLKLLWLSDLRHFFTLRCSQAGKPHTLKTPEFSPPCQRGHENRDDWQRERVCEYVWGDVWRNRVTADVATTRPKGQEINTLSNLLAVLITARKKQQSNSLGLKSIKKFHDNRCNVIKTIMLRQSIGTLCHIKSN